MQKNIRKNDDAVKKLAKQYNFAKTGPAVNRPVSSISRGQQSNLPGMDRAAYLIKSQQ